MSAKVPLSIAKSDGRKRAVAVGGGQAQGNSKQKQEEAKTDDAKDRAKRKRRKRRLCPLSAFEKSLYHPVREADYPKDWVIGEDIPTKVTLDTAMKLLFHPKASTAYKQGFLLLLWKIHGDEGPEILLRALQDHEKDGFPVLDPADLKQSESSPSTTPKVDDPSGLGPATSPPEESLPLANADMPSNNSERKAAEDTPPDADRLQEVLAAPTSSRLIATSGPHTRAVVRSSSEHVTKPKSKSLRASKSATGPVLRDIQSADNKNVSPTSPICLPQSCSRTATAKGGCLPRIFDSGQSSSELLKDDKKDSFKKLPRLSSQNNVQSLPRQLTGDLSAQSSLRGENLEIGRLDSQPMANQSGSLLINADGNEPRPTLDSLPAASSNKELTEAEKENNKNRPSKHLHLIELIELWIQNYPEDLQREFAKKLLVWCKGLAREEWDSSQVRKDWQRVITGLRSLKKSVSERDVRDSKGESKARLDKKVNVIDEYFHTQTPRDFEKGGIDLLEVPTGLLAEQLTLMELDLFRKIKPRELTRRAWEKGKKPTPHSESGNVRLFSSHADKLSYMVATEILMQKKLSRRRLMMQKIYDLCAVMHDMKNYHSCLMLFHGIMLPQIHRLGRLRWLVREDKKFRDLDERFHKLQDAELNNRQYRREFSKLFEEDQRSTPLLPYMPIFTKDLEKMDRVVLQKQNDEQMVNLVNLRKHCLIIKELLICQNRCRQYRTNEPIPELQEKLREEMQKGKSPTDLKQLSVEVEPKLSAEQHNQAQLIYALQDFGFM